MTTLHQNWFGKAMPEKYAGWCNSMRSLAEGLGMAYHHHAWEEISAEYADNPMVAILSEAMRTLPTATTYALASDWHRLRVLADKGGWYADSDFKAVKMTNWRPTADIAFFNETQDGAERLATELMFCNGRRGQEACGILVAGAEERVMQLLGTPNERGWHRNYIEQVRSDCDTYRLIGLIGPGYVRDELLPKLTEKGYTWEAIPTHVACNLSVEKSVGNYAMVHMSGASWVNRFDWNAAVEKAAEMDAQFTPAAQPCI